MEQAMHHETLAENYNSTLTNHGLHVVNDTLIATAPDVFDDSEFMQRGFKFKVQHPVLGYWRLLKKLHRVS